MRHLYHARKRIVGWLKCEHCWHKQEDDGTKPVEDVVCTKCRMTRDKE